jgi:carbon monoxide dehydrogenase subunit G
MITLHGTYRLNAPPVTIWPRIFDPASLMKLIPGCQQLERVGPDEYRGQIRLGIAAVGGTYRTTVKITEQRQPEYCSFAGEVAGPTGVIKGTVAFTLKEVEPGITEFEYESRGLSTGALGTLGARYIQGVAQTMIAQGVAKFNQELSPGER